MVPSGPAPSCVVSRPLPVSPLPACPPGPRGSLALVPLPSPRWVPAVRPRVRPGRSRFRPWRRWPGGGRGLWGRLGETRLGRWVRALCHDYSSSALEAWSGARRRPGRALGALTLLGALGVCAGSVPDLQALEGAAVAAGGALGRLPPGCRSPRAEERVRRLLRLRERGRLRVLSLGVLALAREDPHGADPALYSALCPHLRPPLLSPPLDVGFLGRWWGLSRALRDCDVNEAEFAALPEPLRRLDPRALRSERNERLFQERLRPVVLREEDMEGEGDP